VAVKMRRLADEPELIDVDSRLRDIDARIEALEAEHTRIFKATSAYAVHDGADEVPVAERLLMLEREPTIKRERLLALAKRVGVVEERERLVSTVRDRRARAKLPKMREVVRRAVAQGDELAQTLASLRALEDELAVDRGGVNDASSLTDVFGEPSPEHTPRWTWAKEHWRRAGLLD
jgi:hypothetical protein